MSRWIDIDDDRNCYCVCDGEYEKWSIDPEVLADAKADVTERKRGKWFLGQNGQFRCSNCERVPVNRIIIDATLVYDVPAIKEYMKYCPMCGAKME